MIVYLYSYKMMYNEELVKIPIRKLLHSNGIVAVWCTNSSNHLNSIFNEMFPSWGITYRAKWYWLKVSNILIKSEINAISIK